MDSYCYQRCNLLGIKRVHSCYFCSNAVAGKDILSEIKSGDLLICSGLQSQWKFTILYCQKVDSVTVQTAYLNSFYSVYTSEDASARLYPLLINDQALLLSLAEIFSRKSHYYKGKNNYAKTHGHILCIPIHAVSHIYFVFVTFVLSHFSEELINKIFVLTNLLL